MKSTGVTRKLDPLGRIVLPSEIRRTYTINANDPLEIFVDGEKIILKKYEISCIFCGDKDIRILRQYKGKYICSNCGANISCSE